MILSGLGIHGGLSSNLTLSVSESIGPDQAPRILEPRFSFPGASRFWSVKELGGLSKSSARSTILSGENFFIRTPEHLMATLLFFSQASIDISCDAEELPFMDGSALDFREALSQLAPQFARQPAWREYDCSLNWDYAWTYGHIRVRPSSKFKVTYIVDQVPLRQTVVAVDPDFVWNEILPARSFAFHGEWKKAVKMGLMAGAGLESGLLLAETHDEHAALLAAHSDWRGGIFPLLNQPDWRVDFEPAKHKVLDLLGDLALHGLGLPKLDIEICNGGHAIHHLLLDKLALN